MLLRLHLIIIINLTPVGAASTKNDAEKFIFKSYQSYTEQTEKIKYKTYTGFKEKM